MASGRLLGLFCPSVFFSVNLSRGCFLCRVAVRTVVVDIEHLVLSLMCSRCSVSSGFYYPISALKKRQDVYLHGERKTSRNYNKVLTVLSLTGDIFSDFSFLLWVFLFYQIFYSEHYGNDINIIRNKVLRKEMALGLY